MSTQKAKFELFNRLQALGFTYDEAWALRRIEMTLHRWAEQECGDSNNFASWAIERDEKTGVPYRVTYPHSGKSYRTRIADREAGALRRLEAILADCNARNAGALSYYHQSDPRGCALYIIRPGDVPCDHFLPVETPEGWAIQRKDSDEKPWGKCESRVDALNFAHRQTIEAFYTRGIAVAA